MKGLLLCLRGLLYYIAWERRGETSSKVRTAILDLVSELDDYLQLDENGNPYS